MNIYWKVKLWLQEHDRLLYCNFEKFTPAKKACYRHIEYIFYLIPTIQIRQDILPSSLFGPSLFEDKEAHDAPIFPYTKGIEISIYFLFWGFRLYCDKRIHK